MRACHCSLGLTVATFCCYVLFKMLLSAVGIRESAYRICRSRPQHSVMRKCVMLRSPSVSLIERQIYNNQSQPDSVKVCRGCLARTAQRDVTGEPRIGYRVMWVDVRRTAGVKREPSKRSRRTWSCRYCLRVASASRARQAAASNARLLVLHRSA